MKHRLKLVVLLCYLLLAACQAPAPGIGDSPLAAPAGRGPAITCTVEPAQNYHNLNMESIRLTTDYVLALTPYGFYRATLKEHRWVHLHCPGNLPTEGSFASHVQPTDPILFSTKQGLFSTSDNGNTWHLVSNAYSFDNAFVHPDGTLYAITTIRFPCPESIHDAKSALDFLRGKSWNHTCRSRSFIVMSSDFGQDWHDITNNIDRKFYLQRISPDPDHSDLIVLDGGAFNDYILQATDKNYNWQMYKTSNWRKNHALSSQDFFAKDYRAQTHYYALGATLTNYFDYNFGEQVYLPGFDLLTDQTDYAFVPAGSKIITATIKFLPATDSAQLIDLKDSTDLWGIRILDSAGHNFDQLPKLAQSFAQSSSRQKSMLQYRGRPDFYRFTVNHTQTYTKSIDLDDLFNLSVPGVYQVQLIYNDASLVDRDHWEWGGSFAGKVFTVTVTPP
ncbi:hypothetical protein TFLX_01706 [Thermoflexales bacterium]|nr:hypothetical protein TFLX_01706 [Thermoflexales bacterium]